jgi:hypothetical protein
VYKSIDIQPILDQYNALLSVFKSFLDEIPLPSVKTELIGYHQRCNQCEASLLNLKSEIRLTKAEIIRDIKSLSKEFVKNSMCTDQWEMKRKLENHPPISDAQMSVDKLDAMSDVLENYIWVFKSNKTISIENYKYTGSF